MLLRDGWGGLLLKEAVDGAAAASAALTPRAAAAAAAAGAPALLDAGGGGRDGVPIAEIRVTVGVGAPGPVAGMRTTPA